jgi:hypothetical protein
MEASTKNYRIVKLVNEGYKMRDYGPQKEGLWIQVFEVLFILK